MNSQGCNKLILILSQSCTLALLSSLHAHVPAGRNLQPEKDHSWYFAFYYIIFILVCTYFIVNVFIGIMVLHIQFNRNGGMSGTQGPLGCWQRGSAAGPTDTRATRQTWSLATERGNCVWDGAKQCLAHANGFCNALLFLSAFEYLISRISSHFSTGG